jgi:hypothetical protein
MRSSVLWKGQAVNGLSRLFDWTALQTVTKLAARINRIFTSGHTLPGYVRVESPQNSGRLRARAGALFDTNRPRQRPPGVHGCLGGDPDGLGRAVPSHSRSGATQGRHGATHSPAPSRRIAVRKGERGMAARSVRVVRLGGEDRGVSRALPDAKRTPGGTPGADPFRREARGAGDCERSVDVAACRTVADLQLLLGRG